MIETTQRPGAFLMTRRVTMKGQKMGSLAETQMAYLRRGWWHEGKTPQKKRLDFWVANFVSGLDFL